MRFLQYITLYLRLVFMYRTLERVRGMSEVDYVERNQVRLFGNFGLPYASWCVDILCRKDNFMIVKRKRMLAG